MVWRCWLAKVLGCTVRRGAGVEGGVRLAGWLFLAVWLPAL